MTNWTALKPDDIVDVVAPGYGFKPHDLPKMAEFLRSHGLVPRIPEAILGNDPLCANREQARFDQLSAALQAEDSKAVWCAKGGYGTASLLPHLAEPPRPAQEKLVIGFSDITALHLFLTQAWGWQPLHGCVLWQIIHGKVDAETIIATLDVVFGRTHELLYLLTHVNGMAKSVSGKLCGGNMMLLQNSIGTPWEVQASGNILFIEDVDERPYRAARVLTHMEQAGLFDSVGAVIFGDFTFQDFKDETESLNDVITGFAMRKPFPVYRVEGIGHAKRNMPLPLNTMAKIENNILTVKVGRHSREGGNDARDSSD